MDWTADQIAQLRELWPSGLTTAEMGKRLHVTKFAVIGKAHRLGLPGKPSPIRNDDYSPARAKAMVEWHAQGRPLRTPPPKPYAPPRAKPLKQNFPEAPQPPNPADRYLAMGTEAKPCEFLTGDARPYKPCGDDKVIGKPFCPSHCAQSYIKIRPRQMTEADAVRIRVLADNAARLQQETEQCQ